MELINWYEDFTSSLRSTLTMQDMNLFDELSKKNISQIRNIRSEDGTLVFSVVSESGETVVNAGTVYDFFKSESEPEAISRMVDKFNSRRALADIDSDALKNIVESLELKRLPSLALVAMYLKKVKSFERSDISGFCLIRNDYPGVNSYMDVDFVFEHDMPAVLAEMLRRYTYEYARRTEHNEREEKRKQQDATYCPYWDEPQVYNHETIAVFDWILEREECDTPPY